MSISCEILYFVAMGPWPCTTTSTCPTPSTPAINHHVFQNEAPWISWILSTKSLVSRFLRSIFKKNKKDVKNSRLFKIFEAPFLFVGNGTHIDTRSVSFCKCRLRWVDALPKGWKKNITTSDATEALFVFFLGLVNHGVKGRQNWMEHGHLIWLWMVWNGLQPRGISQVLVIEVWIDMINVYTLTLELLVRFCMMLSIAPLIDKNPTETNQTVNHKHHMIHACLKVEEPFQRRYIIQLWKYLQNCVVTSILFSFLFQQNCDQFVVTMINDLFQTLDWPGQLCVVHSAQEGDRS